jgi:hypothetical protein
MSMPPIPPVIMWTVGVLGAAALARALMREWRRVNATLHAPHRQPASDELAREQIPTLRRDPRTGVYRAD